MALLELLIIAAGCFIVAKSSGVVVDKSVILSGFFKMSPFVIGLVLVALSTSLPEFTLAVVSLLDQAGGISAGNVFGANVANVALVLGLGALLYGFNTGKKSMKSARNALLLSVAVAAYIVLHELLDGSALGFYEALGLLALFLWFAVSSIFEKKEPTTLVFDTRLEHLPREQKKEVRVGREEGAKALGIFIVAVAVLMASSYAILEAAVRLAIEFNVAEGFIGATLIALGTTLPELSVALQSFRKKQYGLGLGNAFGSVIVNTTLVLGTAALFGLVLAPFGIFLIAMGFVAVSLLLFRFLGAFRERFGTREGVVLLLVYAAYLAAITYVQFGPG